MTDVHRCNAGVALALREASASDPEAARLLRQAEQRRRADVARGLAMVTGQPVTDEDSDGLWAVTDVEVYRLLTDLRGWSAEQYDSWLADVIGRLLPHRARRT